MSPVGRDDLGFKIKTISKNYRDVFLSHIFFFLCVFFASIWEHISSMILSLTAVTYAEYSFSLKSFLLLNLFAVSCNLSGVHFKITLGLVI